MQQTNLSDMEMIKIKHIIGPFLLYLLCSCNDYTQYKSGLEGQLFPDFKLTSIENNQIINTKNILTNKNIVLFFFSPDCPYCRAQTKNIISNINQLENIKLVMVSNFPIEKLKKFYEHFELYKYSNISLNKDCQSSLINYFKVTSVPYFAIYSKDKILKKVLSGKTDINIINQIIKDKNVAQQ